MKRLIAGGITALLVALLLWSGRSQTPAPAASRGRALIASGGPEDYTRQLLDLARDGDVPGYLAAFGGELQARLRREADELGHAAFAAALRATAAARKGHAVFASEPDGPDAASVVVESVYPDRNERQTFRLERVGEAWSIVAVETVRTHEPKSRFGALAVFEGPDAPPLPPDGTTD